MPASRAGESPALRHRRVPRVTAAPSPRDAARQADCAAEPRSENDDRTDRLAALHHLEALADLLELQAVRDERIEIDLLLDVPVDDLRQPAEARTAHVAAGPVTTHHQAARRRGDFRAVRRDADDVARAP